MKAIVCVNNNWAIGKNGDLLYSLPGDMKFFRETTKGKTVIMGRKTLNSFPNGNPLKNRVNIVISSNPDEKEGVVWVKTPFEALEKTSDFSETFLIGGASIYSQLIDYCSEALVTIVDDEKEGDTYFPNLYEKTEWFLEKESDSIFENGFRYKFCLFKNKNPKEI